MRHAASGNVGTARRSTTLIGAVHHPFRCRALPRDVEGIAKALSSAPLPASVSELLADADGWASRLEPHFGSRALASAVDTLAARAPQLPRVGMEVPQLPSLELGSAVAGALQPLTDAAARLSEAASTATPRLPHAPAVSFPLSVHLEGPVDFLPSQLSHTLSEALGAATTGLGAAVGGLPAGAAPGVGFTELPPHFGTAAAVRGLDALVGWVADRFASVGAAGGVAGGGLAALDPDTAAALTSALDELRRVAGVMTMPPALGAAGSSTLQHLAAALSALTAGLQGLTGATGGEGAAGAAAGPGVWEPQALLDSLAAVSAQAHSQGVGGYSLTTVVLLGALTLMAVAASAPGEGYQGPEDPYAYGADDALTHEYDPDVVASYFARRPLMVVRRSAQVAAEAASFGSALLLDLWTGRLEANERRRAEQLRGVVERLGPAYVKVAQALSTRVDLLPPAYLEQVQRLQDQVPTFPCELATREMEKAFGGRPLEAVFSHLSDKPVAAASLGQVYRATLRPELGGGDVAVKVQRPGVLEQVSLDLLIMRRVAVVMKDVLKMHTDWGAVIDAWAVRFLHEMDYRREATNAATFAGHMRAAGVEGVVVAAVRTDLSSGSVLTTEWVEGEKLSESRSSDVRSLCCTLLNAYLIQLLDTGFLHADPHPGNLLRTPEGKICVLDFGLVTEVTPQQRIALVEYIAHLSTGDWEALAGDLQTLGFISPGVDTRQAGLVEPLGRVMSQLVGGGGAAKVNIDKVMGDLEALGKTYPIQVPPFFALILRAFSVIEGIALRVDPQYAIVSECFPYLATRLLRDDSPRMRAVLRDLLYGGRQRMDVQRLMRLADGLAAFTTDGLGPAGAGGGGGSVGSVTEAVVTVGRGGGEARGGGGGGAERWSATPAVAMAVVAGGEDEPVLSPVVVDTLRSVLRPGSYVSELLVEELVAAVDALSREALSLLMGGVLGSLPGAAALSLQRSVEALGPLRAVLLPLPTPVEVLMRLAPAVAVTPEDREALGVVRAILTLAHRLATPQQQPQTSSPYSPPTTTATITTVAATVTLPLAGGGGAVMRPAVPTPARVARLASELRTLLPELAPGLAYTGDLFVRALVRRLTSRALEAFRLAADGGRGVGGGGDRVGSAGSAVKGLPGVASAAPFSEPAVAMRVMGGDVRRSVGGVGGTRAG